MPPGLHTTRSASFVCHWHTGCNKRFSSKRQLHRHLEMEHGLKRDADRGWRATGLGARTRRRDRRSELRLRPRSPRERNAIMLEDLEPALVTSPHVATRVSFSEPAPRSLSSSSPSAAVSAPHARYPTSRVQLSRGIGREVVSGSTPAGSSVGMPRPSKSAPAETPQICLSGSSATAARPPSSAVRPPASSAGMPPTTMCDEGARAVAFGVSPGPVPIRPPARPHGGIDDDLWVSSRWNVWTRDSGKDAASVRL